MSRRVDVGCLEHVDGSCRWIEDGTYVIASTSGPRHVPEKSQDPERGAIEVRCQVAERHASERMAVERRVEEHVLGVLRQSVDLDQLARQLVTIAILVVLDDGASRRVSLNAAVAALLDAAVPMKAVPLSVHVPGALLTYNASEADEFLAFESHQPFADLDACFAAADHQRDKLLALMRRDSEEDR